MNPDGFDRFVRSNVSPVEISPERIEAVIDSVLAHVDPVPAPHRVMRSWAVFRELMELVMPVSRFAVPMAAAAVLGVAVAWHMDAVLSDGLGSLLVSAPLAPLGS